MSHIGDVSVGSPSRARNAGSESAVERSKLSREQFLKILTAQLSQQDPLNPIENQDFISQLSSLQNLEAVSALTDGIKGLQKSQQIGAASALIGKSVRGTTDLKTPIEGVVEKVTIKGSDVRLIIDGFPVSLNNVTEILPATPQGR